MDKLVQLNKITSLRFIAAIYVVAFHHLEALNFLGNTLLLLFHHGYIAVSFFFVLSGYILTYSYISKVENLNTFSFLKKRLYKLYPAYIVAILSSLILGIYFYIHTPSVRLSLFEDIYVVISSILMLQSWTPNLLVSVLHACGPAWSLSVEVFLYLSFPLSLVYLSKMSNASLKSLVILAGLVTLSAIAYFGSSISFNHYFDLANDTNFNTWNRYIQIFPLSHLPQFILGIIVSILVHRGVIKNNKKLNLFFYSSLILLFILLFTNILPGYMMNNGILAIFFTIILAKANLSRSKNILENKMFVRLGDASYHLYIFAWPISRLFTIIYNKTNIVSNETTQFFIYLVSLCAISLFTHRTEQKIKLNYFSNK